jgi:arylsulfatase A-like enzyme
MQLKFRFGVLMFVVSYWTTNIALPAETPKKPNFLVIVADDLGYAVRHGDWKLVQYDLNVESFPTRGVTKKMLYHLAKDVHEIHDLADEQPEKVKELDSLWQAWNSQLAKPLW